MIVPAVVPAAEGVHDAEWWLGLGITYLELFVVLLVTESVSRATAEKQRASVRGIGLGLLLSLGAEWALSSAEWLWFPELLVFEGQLPPSYAELVAGAVLFGFMAFAMWVLIFRYPEFVANDAARKHEAQRLRSLVDRRELEARLAPHFLLNTLNAAAGLTSSEPETAREVLVSLGELLRAALYREQDTRHTVAQELTLTRNYAAILEARYGNDRLHFKWAAQPAADRRTLPPLLLQPLVENAVKHGALRSLGPSVISVEAAIETSGTLVLRVENEGNYEPSPSNRGHGVDLVRRRLEFMDERCTLDIESAKGRTFATVRIPAQVTP